MADLNPEEHQYLCSGFLYFCGKSSRIREPSAKVRLAALTPGNRPLRRAAVTPPLAPDPSEERQGLLVSEPLIGMPLGECHQYKHLFRRPHVPWNPAQISEATSRTHKDSRYPIPGVRLLALASYTTGSGASVAP